MRNIPVSQARSILSRLPEELGGNTGESAVNITRRGKPILTVMSYELYESIMETLDIMSDSELMESLKQGIKDIKEGNIIPWEHAKKELEL